MPVLFVGHGSPMNAIEQNSFTESLRKVAAAVPVPEAVCVVSAHWVTRGTEVLTANHPRTIHDFQGFPAALYKVEYPAPGARDEALLLSERLALKGDETWGYDHGSWSLLRHMYPEARIPVFEVSLDHAKSPREHWELGRELAALRKRGVLIIGSGNLVHNLRRMNPQAGEEAFPWAEEFDKKAKAAMESRDMESLTSREKWGETLWTAAHPTLEHYVPLLYCMGATSGEEQIIYPHEGFAMGSISMRMVQFG